MVALSHDKLVARMLDAMRENELPPVHMEALHRFMNVATFGGFMPDAVALHNGRLVVAAAETANQLAAPQTAERLRSLRHTGAVVILATERAARKIGENVIATIAGQQADIYLWLL